MVLPDKEYEEIPSTIEKSLTTVGSAQIGTDTDPRQKKTGTMTRLRHGLLLIVWARLAKGLFQKAIRMSLYQEDWVAFELLCRP